MPLDEKRLSKLKELIKLSQANKSPAERLKSIKELFRIISEGISRKDFIKSFQGVIDHNIRTEKKLVESIDLKTAEGKKKLQQLANEFEQIILEAEKESDSTFGGFKKRSIEIISNLFIKNDVNKKLKEKLDEVNKVLASIRNGTDGTDGIDGVDGIGKDGIDGKDADEKEIIKEVLKKIKVPEIDKTELTELKEELEEVKRLRLRGGGTSAMGVAQAFKWILKTEVPSGAINGLNTTYTVNHVIFAVLAFSLSGEVIMELPNYTISNKTITFATALPAVYSGKDFEIKYI